VVHSPTTSDRSCLQQYVTTHCTLQLATAAHMHAEWLVCSLHLPAAYSCTAVDSSLLLLQQRLAGLRSEHSKRQTRHLFVGNDTNMPTSFCLAPAKQSIAIMIFEQSLHSINTPCTLQDCGAILGPHNLPVQVLLCMGSGRIRSDCVRLQLQWQE